MSKLLVLTQVFENYAWNSDGTLGTGLNAYWKPKGGNDYVVLGVDECDMIDIIVDRVRARVECDSDAFRESVIGWKLVDNDYLTEFERSQLEFEGKIIYPVEVLEV